MEHLPLLTVIASAAKQSRDFTVHGNPGLLRRVAPRNDGIWRVATSLTIPLPFHKK
jgi:hypothetical protein